MHDKTIINMITEIHFNVLAFFGFLLLLIFLGFVALWEGFTISQLKFGDVILEKVYLKWDNRLHIQASLIDLSALQGDDEPLDLSPLKQLPTYIRWTEAWTDSINIDTIVYKDITASIHYRKNETGVLRVQKGKVALSGNFILTPDTFHSNLSTSKNDFVYADGNITIDIPNQNFVIASSLSVKDTPRLQVFIKGDTQRLSLSLSADAPFKRIDNLIDTLNLDPSIRPWITDSLTFKEAVLEECNVNFDYTEDPLEKIVLRGSVHKVGYTFAKKVAPIIAPTVKLAYKDKRLYITPIAATFKTLPLEKSNLNFDFTGLESKLNINILTAHAQLNDSILDLLHNYNITLPLRQKSGTTSVNMSLALNLSTLDTNVKGNFIPTDSTFEIDKTIVKSRGGKVALNNTKVNFSGFNITHEQYGKGSISGVYNGSSSSGQIHFRPTYFTPHDEISLIPLAATVTLHLAPSKNILEVSPTQWKAYNETVHLGGFKAPVNLSIPSINLPFIDFSVLNKLSGKIKAHYSDNHLNTNLILDQLKLFDVQLKNTPLHLSLSTDGSTTAINTKTSSTWIVHDHIVTLAPFSLQNNASGIAIANTHILIDTLLSSDINGKYDLKNNTGGFNLSKIQILDPKISHYFTFKTPQYLAVDLSKKYPLFKLKKLDTTIQGLDLGWRVDIDDLSSLNSSVPLLNQYNITNGDLSLLYAPDTDKTTFSGTVKYPYKLIIINDKMISNYTFKGTYQNKIVDADINERIHLTYDDTIVLKTKNMGINLDEVLRWINSHPSSSYNAPNVSDDNDKNDPAITLYGKNTYIRLADKRQIPSDTLSAGFDGDNGYASLKYADGSAKMTIKSGLFYIEGSNLNNQFMENVFAYSDFIGGKLSFTLKGNNNTYEGLVRIEKVTLKQFKLLTNILAFTNTVSTLTSFSLPNYNQSGLYANEVYTHFIYANDLLSADTFVLDSPEVRIGGNFEVNTNKDTIKGAMTLKSNIATAISHVPIVGYLLLGKDGSLSTTVALSGKASDPTINTAVAKELAVAPYNILKRTVTYPFDWITDSEKKK